MTDMSSSRQKSHDQQSTVETNVDRETQKRLSEKEGLSESSVHQLISFKNMRKISVPSFLITTSLFLKDEGIFKA